MEPNRSLRVRIAAAKTAVAASKRTGRPVDPRVKELAELDVTATGSSTVVQAADHGPRTKKPRR